MGWLPNLETATVEEIVFSGAWWMMHPTVGPFGTISPDVYAKCQCPMHRELQRRSQGAVAPEGG